MRLLAVAVFVALTAVGVIACSLASSTGIVQISDDTYIDSKVGGVLTNSGSGLIKGRTSQRSQGVLLCQGEKNGAKSRHTC